MWGLVSLAVRRRSASLVATAMRQAGGGGGGRLPCSASVGAAGMQSLPRPASGHFALPRGGKRAPLSSLPSREPKKTDHEMVMEKLEQVLATASTIKSVHDMVKRQQSIGWVGFQGVVTLFTSYGLLYLIYNLVNMSDEEGDKAVSYAKVKFHKLSRDEDFIQDVEYVSQRAADAAIKRVNPLNPIMDLWGNWTKEKGTNIHSPWVTSAAHLALYIFVLCSLGGPLISEGLIISTSRAILDYKQELTIELLDALVLIDYLKRRKNRKGDENFYELSRPGLSVDVIGEDFIPKLMEVEKKKKR